MLSYSWNDLAPDINIIMEIVDDPKHVLPPKSQLEEYIRTRTDISEDDKADLITMLNVKPI